MHICKRTCLLQFSFRGPLSLYPWTTTRYPSRNCLISTNLRLLLLRSFLCCDKKKFWFVLRFLYYFGLISTNVDTSLNICDTVRRHCIPKPFVHTVLLLDFNASDMNDATQGTSHASRTNRQMVRGWGSGREHTQQMSFLTVVDTADQVQGYICTPGLSMNVPLSHN